MMKRIREDGQISKEEYDIDAVENTSAGTFNKATPSTLASRKMVAIKSDKKQQFSKHIRALNLSFYTWFKEQCDANNTNALIEGAQDYVDYSSQLSDRYLRQVGDVLTFGSGDCGQCGHGVENDEDLMVSLPRIVRSLRNKQISMIACGGLHNAVVTDIGQVYTWGCADDGSLGRTGDESVPLLVEDESMQEYQMIGVACGDGQTMCWSSSGCVFGWGCYRDKEGKKWFNPTPGAAQPEKDIKKQQNTPLRIAGLSDVVDIACGSVHNLARCTDGSVYSWGLGECGELGRKTNPLRPDGSEYDLKGMLKEHITPGSMFKADSSTPISFVKAIGAGAYHSLVVTVEQDSSQGIHSCGLNNYGQLGLDTESVKMTPYLTRVAGEGFHWCKDSAAAGSSRTGQVVTVMAVKGGVHHSCALLSDGAVYAWGRRDSGQLGIGNSSSDGGKVAAGAFIETPTLVVIPGLAKTDRATQLACGSNHTMLLTKENSVYTWGYGDMSALGHGTDKDENIPKKVSFAKCDGLRSIPLAFTQVAGGGQHSALIATGLSL